MFTKIFTFFGSKNAAQPQSNATQENTMNSTQESRSSETVAEITPIAHLSELIYLLGRKSTDPVLLAFFSARQMKNPPKTVNANQDVKGLADPQNKLSYWFKFDITHDDFYPPVSPKQNDYTFECYLASIGLFARGKPKKPPYLHPAGFWDGYLHPDSSCAEFMAYFGMNDFAEFGVKKLSPQQELVIWFDAGRDCIREMELRIPQDCEWLSHYKFQPGNATKPFWQSPWLIVKWLFDQKLLILSDEVYQQGLPLNEEAIREFVRLYLRNHLWESQCHSHNRKLGSFFYHLTTNSSYTTHSGERISIYVNNLFMQAAGLAEKYQEMQQEEYSQQIEFEHSIRLNPAQQQRLLEILNEAWQGFQIQAIQQGKSWG
ncbi:hypothetical protein [Chitinibacter sp. GC72]|uniref:hypothetical protein n=1 Tax=Chitinibacter sp. GC72 TaxID=1526917 RepID=UPI0012F96750|nr:hypothetical protein [Chitinibacter sp. GC72]